MLQKKQNLKYERVLQLLPAAHTGDATGNQARLLDGLFTRLGYESRIYAMTIDDPLREKIYHFDSFKDDYNPSSDILWMHFNLPSPLTDEFISSTGKKIMQFHNFTPYEYFLPFNPPHSKNMRRAEEELKKLKDSYDFTLCDSKFNFTILQKLGFKNLVHFPLIFDESVYRNNGSETLKRIFEGSTKNILFVGRVVPNKKIEDLMACYAYIKKYIRDDCRLIIAGKYNHDDEYFRYLIRHIGQFSAEGIIFTGELTQEELTQYYMSADLFLSFSEHEGFFMPMLEAFHFGVPVIAREAAAVGETSGGGALLFKERDIVKAAELAVEVLNNDDLRNELIRKGKYRVLDFNVEKSLTRLESFLRML